MKNKNKFLIGVILGFIVFSTVNADSINYKIKDVTLDSSGSLNVVSENPLTASGVSGDIKLFKDLEILSITKDELLPSKLNVKLGNEVKVGTTYNIFSVFGVDGTADFIVEDGLSIKMLSKAPTEQGIIRVGLKDSKTMELFFKDSLAGTEFEFKLLEDLTVVDINSNDGKLVLKTESTLEQGINYILMIISLSDSLGNNYSIDESIYSFLLGGDEIKKVEPKVEEKVEKTQDILETNQIEPLTGSLDNADSKNLGNVVEVAKKVKETPDTGAETWILILLTLIINSFYFLTRRTIK